MPDPVAYRLRPAVAGDLDRMFACYAATMRHHVEQAWGWDFDFQRQGFLRSLTRETAEVIEVNDEFAGFLWLQHSPDGAMLRLMCLETRHQRKRIGSSLIANLIAREHGLRLKVFKTNPAAGLYLRLGFVQVAEDEHMVEMVCARNAPAT